ncbi:MAG: MFS transporter [bacterium]|nr:MFS transporter [bacterium]
MNVDPEVDASDPPGMLIGILAGAAIGFAAQGSLPILLGAVIDGLGISEAAAGLLASVEIGMVAAVSLLVAPRIHRLPRRRLAIAGAVIACVGQALSIRAMSFEALLFARLIAGIGEGAAFATANASIAGAVDPERVSARLALIGGAGAGVLLAVLPYLIEPFGYAGGFGVLLVVGLICLPLLRFLPDAPGGATRAQHSRKTHMGYGVALMVGFFALALGGSAMWAFTERIGMHVGLSRDQIGGVLAVTMIFGLLGAGLASWLGTRRGRLGPLTLGLIGIALATLLLGASRNASLYSGMLLLWTFTFLFAMPYLMGTAAELDKEGRWAAATIGFWSAGSAAGPASAGTLLLTASYPALGLLVSGCSLLALGLVLPVALKVRGTGFHASDA